MPKIFISYRRADSKHATGRICDRLTAHFPSDEVFIDVDDIPKGVDYREHLNQAVSQCDILLAVIGERWLESSFKEGPKQGQRRLDDPDDSVRIEIQAALTRAIPVIPVLVDDVGMPNENQLPVELSQLAFRNATPIDSGRDFHSGVDQLIRDIKRLLEQAGYREVKVPGWWDSRPEDDLTAEWKEISRLPAKVSVVQGQVYRVRASENAIDDDLASLVHPQALTTLRELNLSHCRQITDAGLVFVSALTRLQVLKVVYTRISDLGLAQLAGLTGLRELNLSTCVRVSDEGLVHLRGLNSLRELDLGNCSECTDEGLTHLWGLTGLQVLDIGFSKVTDAGLAGLRELTGLQTLGLRGTKVTDAGLAHLESLAALRDINLDRCMRVTDAGLAHLRGLARLQKLQLSEMNVTDAGLAHLQILTGLQWLGLGLCKHITDAGLAYLRGLTSLDYLCLTGCEQIPDAGLAHLQALTALRHLDLPDRITDAGLAHLRGMTNLQELSLSGCDLITDAGLTHLPELSALQQLSLAWTSVTDAGLAHLRGLNRLKRLDLSYCAQITDAGLIHLRELKALEELDRSDCEYITEAGFKKLQKTLPKLQSESSLGW